mgnify:CR=1 FL=1
MNTIVRVKDVNDKLAEYNRLENVLRRIDKVMSDIAVYHITQRNSMIQRTNTTAIIIPVEVFDTIDEYLVKLLESKQKSIRYDLDTMTV